MAPRRDIIQYYAMKSTAIFTVIFAVAEKVFVEGDYTRTYTNLQPNITIDCHGSGYPKPTITWLRHNDNVLKVDVLSNNDTTRVVQVVHNRISLPLENVTSRLYLRTAGINYNDGGNYSCRVSSHVRPVLKTIEILSKH